MPKTEGTIEARPSWWNYWGHLLFGWLLLPAFIAWWKRASKKLLIHEERVVVKEGVLSRNTTEVFIEDIRTVDTSQGLIQRIVGIGDVRIATAGTAGYEDVIPGLPEPKKLKRTVMERRKRMKGSRD